jgi:crotonobetainyl-CoA:carnitine CoA-transferase CaiB-like acyl-CoA transferase
MLICLPDYDVYFEKFMRLIGREDLLGEEDISTIVKVFELKTTTKVIDAVSEAIAKRPIGEWMKLFKENDVPCERGYTPEEMLEDEQAWANDFLRKIQYPSGNERILTTSPVQFKSMGCPDMVPSKPLGHHTTEVLMEAGYSDVEIEKMRAEQAII